IHSKNIIHRDIKPGNILMMSRRPPVAKVGDLGLARHINFHGMTVAGTPHYIAPEGFTGRYDSKVDCWSLGMVVYNM
ncbi:kinase-like protein, partial [Panus rudis PR-1116 ss-1]